MANFSKSPAELRSMFGANLRKLSKAYPSISELSRQLGINRTQFNRYLAGESFPRPDVLARICDFFDVDARVLLEPVEQIADTAHPFSNAVLKDYLDAATYYVAEEQFPTGFYRFSRRSFLETDIYVEGIVRVWREGEATYVRGLEQADAMRSQGLPPTASAREFRGILMQQEGGVSSLITRKGGRTVSFNFLTRASAMENNFWSGYVVRTMPESVGTDRAVRMVYEHLGNSVRDALPARRAAGYKKAGELLPFHQRLLKLEEPFH